ncbi:MAG: hypothetical protein WED04_02650 [Promethearchaeati archaeon SRVP18_Atabeyarchaeia-1]
MELSLEKVMLTFVGLLLASMICMPLIEGGITQVHDQYAYSQFKDLIDSIDNGVNKVVNDSGQNAFQKDIYVPSTVTVKSSMNVVSYYFSSSSITSTIYREYPVNVDVCFNYAAGFYRVHIAWENSTWIAVVFAHLSG